MMFSSTVPIIRYDLLVRWRPDLVCLAAGLLALCLTASPIQAGCKNSPEKNSSETETPVWVRSLNELDQLLTAEESFDPYDPTLPYSEGEQQGIACTALGVVGVLGALAVGGSEYMIIAGGGTLYAHSPGVLILALFSNAYAAGCATGALLIPFVMRGYEDAASRAPASPNDPSCKETQAAQETQETADKNPNILKRLSDWWHTPSQLPPQVKSETP